MSYYGFTVTNKGRELIAKLVAGEQLVLSRIMVGEGVCSDEESPKDLTDLVSPVAAATSTVPHYDGANVRFIVEYRSDLNGGLDRGFWLSEFGVFAMDPDEGEVLIYYGCLGEYPQWVSAYSESGVDVRRFPVCIVIGDESGVQVEFDCEAWMTADDVDEYASTTLLPRFLDDVRDLISAHNADADAHPAIQALLTGLDSRVTLLELIINTHVDGNPFTVTFGTLTGVTVEGVWNESAQRIEF